MLVIRIYGMNKEEEDQLRCIAQLVDGATLLKAGRSVSGCM